MAPHLSGSEPPGKDGTLCALTRATIRFAGRIEEVTEEESNCQASACACNSGSTILTPRWVTTTPHWTELHLSCVGAATWPRYRAEGRRSYAVYFMANSVASFFAAGVCLYLLILYCCFASFIISETVWSPYSPRLACSEPGANFARNSMRNNSPHTRRLSGL